MGINDVLRRAQAAERNEGDGQQDDAHQDQPVEAKPICAEAGHEAAKDLAQAKEDRIQTHHGAAILGVHKGQTEASLSLGLTNRQTMFLVILPQAMRILIPPLTNQYLNIIKSTTLGATLALRLSRRTTRCFGLTSQAKTLPIASASSGVE